MPRLNKIHLPLGLCLLLCIPQLLAEPTTQKPTPDAKQPVSEKQVKSKPLLNTPDIKTPADNTAGEQKIVIENRLIQESDAKWFSPGDLINILAIVIGAWIIVWQNGRQHNNELKLQRENYKEKFRLDVYREFRDALKEAEEKTLYTNSYVLNIPSEFENYMSQIKQGQRPPPLVARAKVFSEISHEAIMSLGKLIYMFERYEVICPSLEVFKLAMKVSSEDLDNASYSLFNIYLKLLPVDILHHGEDQRSPAISNIVLDPPKGMEEQLKILTGTYVEHYVELHGYLEDLNTELQNVFLSNLFEHKATIRKPLNPRLKVITTDPENLKELKRFFLEDTNWGKTIAKMDAELVEYYKNKKPDDSD